MTTTIKEYIKGDGTSFFRLEVRYPDGKRRRIRFSTKQAAQAEAQSLHNQVKLGGNIWASMDARSQAEVLFAFKEARDLGVTMFDLLDFYKKNVGDKNLGGQVTLRQMVEETVATARARKLSAKYIDDLSWCLSSFIDGRESQPVSHVRFTEIENFLAGLRSRDHKSKAAPATVMGFRSRISAMFNEAVRRDYIHETANPMRKVVVPKTEAKPIVFLTPKQAHDMLWVCRVTAPQFLAYFTLGLFAGIRPEELEKLHWRSIDLDRGEIVIDESVAKTRMRRIIELKIDGKLRPEFAALHAWLQLCPTQDGYIVPIDGDRKNNRPLHRQISQWVQRHRNRLVVRTGHRWAHDILRKTACTYLMVRIANEHIVAGILGNSPKIIYRHYRGLTRRDDADAFFNLTPDNVKNDPLKLPIGGQGNYAGKLIP